MQDLHNFSTPRDPEWAAFECPVCRVEVNAYGECECEESKHEIEPDHGEEYEQYYLDNPELLWEVDDYDYERDEYEY